jgi:hypothetical protein
VPPDRIALWFPVKLKPAAYAIFRDMARETLKAELPEVPPKGFVTFDLDWRPRPAASAIEAPNVPSVRPASSNTPGEEERPPSEEVRMAAGPATLRELLDQLESETSPRPHFRLHPVAWVVGGLWLLATWGFGLYLSILTGEHGRLFLAILETAFVLLGALGLAFIPYVRDPTRRLVPSLVLCAVFVAHAAWIVASFVPGKAEIGEAFMASETEVCGKVFACGQPAETQRRLVAECVQRRAQRASERARLPTDYWTMSFLMELNRRGLDKCASLQCDEFATCFDRETGLQLLPAAEKG